MGKQLKKIAKYSMAAALATSALVPSAVALAADEKAVAKDITKVVVKNANDVLVELDIQDYGAALLFDTIVDTDIKYIVADNGDVYDLQDYGQALLFNDTKEGALESLKDKAVDVNTLDIKEGTISEDGKAVPNDETPSTKEDLTKAIEEAKEVAADEKLAADKKEALEKAIDKAEAVAAKEDATAEDIAAAVKALNEAVAEAKGEEEPAAVAVESVKAINETEVLVTLGEDAEVTEETLAGQQVTLTAGEEVLTATYLAESLSEGTAVFVLAEDTKLADASTYTLTADWTTSVIDFTTEFGAAYAKGFEFVTTQITEAATSTVYLTAVDQYGKEYEVQSSEVTGDDKNIEVKVSINGVPQAASNFNVSVENGEIKVLINKPVEETNTVTVEVVNTLEEEVVATASKTYTVGEKAAATPAEILKLTATDSEDEAADSFVVGEEYTLTADVRDTNGNKVAATEEKVVTWVVEKGKVTEATPIEGKVTQTFTPQSTGELVISAYLANGKKLTFTTSVSAKALESLTVADFASVKNNEDAKVLVTADPVESALTPEQLTYEVTSTPKDVKAEDVAVSFAYGKDADKDKIFATVKTPVNGQGEYKVKFSAAGKSIEKTFTSAINTTVAGITVDEVKANELQVNGTIYKAIKFVNKHNEEVTVSTTEGLTLVKTTGLSTVAFKGANAEGTVNTEADISSSNPIKYVAVTAGAAEATNQSVTIVKDNGTAQVKMDVVKAGLVKSVTLGSGTFSAIKGDTLNKESKTDNIAFVGGNGYTLIPVSAVDTYGVNRDLKASDFDIAATEKVDVKFFASTEDNSNKTDDNVIKYIGVHLDADYGKASYELKATLADGVADTSYVEAKKTVTAKAARVATKLDVKATSTLITTGGTTKVTIVPTDNHGDFIEFGENTVIKVATNATLGSEDITIADSDKKVDKDGKLVGYEVELTGAAKGDGVVTVTASDKTGKTLVSATQNIKVDSVGALVDSVEIVDPGLVDNSASKYTDGVDLEVVGKDKDGKAVKIADADLTWSIKSVTDEKGKEFAVTSGNGLSFTVSDSATPASPLNGKEFTIDKNTGKLTSNAAVTADVKVGVVTSNAKKAELTVSLNGVAPKFAKDLAVKTVDFKLTDAEGKPIAATKAEDLEGNGLVLSIGKDQINTTAGKINDLVLTFTGVDQYGNAIPKFEDTITFSSDDTAVVAPSASTGTTLTIEAKDKGTATIYATIGGETLPIEVTVEDVVGEYLAAQKAYNDAVTVASEAKVEVGTITDGVEKTTEGYKTATTEIYAAIDEADAKTTATGELETLLLSVVVTDAELENPAKVNYDDVTYTASAAGEDVATDAKWVTATAIATLKTALAKGADVSAKTSSEIEAIIEEIESAIATFVEGAKAGTKS